MIEQEIINAAKAAVKAAGYVASEATSARTKFVPQEALQAGVYTPKFTGVQPAIMCSRRNGNDYEGLVFVGANGKDIRISLSAILNSLRIVQVSSLSPDNLIKGAKWAGETAMPTKRFFRYGKLSDMKTEEVNDNGKLLAMYEPVAVNLTTKVVYVVPRFVAGKPVFDEECELRTALCADDYLSFPDQYSQD